MEDWEKDLEFNNGGDSAVSQNHSDPNPIIKIHPFQNPTSQIPPFDHSVIQNCYIRNPKLESHSPMNFSQCQSSGSGWLNPAVATSGVEGLEADMSRLRLTNPSSNIARIRCNNVGIDFSMYTGYEQQQLQWQRPRIDAAARGYLRARHSLKCNGIGIGSEDHYGNRSLHGSTLGCSKSLTSSLNGEQRLLSPLHHNFSSLEDVRGQLVSMAKDQYGCRFLLQKFDEGKPEEIELIFCVLKEHLHELMIDHFGNYLIQKFFEACSVDQMTTILRFIIRNEQKLKDVCIDNYGTRAIQKLLEHLKTPDQKSEVIWALRYIAVALAKNINGGYVIQQCLKLFSPAVTKVILYEVAGNCVNIGTDRSGCSVLQKCLGHAQGEAMERLIDEIVSNALVLSEDPYGNYVVQYVVKMKIPQKNAAIIFKLKDQYVQLSMNKHASNVVEDLLEFSEERYAAKIIQEIMNSRDGFLNVLQNPYGNYVAQRALKNSKGTLHKDFSNKILSNYACLHGHPYGKRVLAVAKGCKNRA